MAAKKDDSKKGGAALEEIEKIEQSVGLKTKKERPARAASAKTGPAKSGQTLTIRLVRSGICTPRDQKATLRGLGLRRLNHTVVRPDSAAVRGMIHKVRHLVEVATERA
jgi:large subunit ribosomal protein L30